MIFGPRMRFHLYRYLGARLRIGYVSSGLSFLNNIMLRLQLWTTEKWNTRSIELSISDCQGIGYRSERTAIIQYDMFAFYFVEPEDGVLDSSIL